MHQQILVKLRAAAASAAHRQALAVEKKSTQAVATIPDGTMWELATRLPTTSL